MASLIDSVPDEQFKQIITSSTSFAECLQKLGYVAKSGTMYNILKQRIERLGIDTQHFCIAKRKERSRENIFVDNADCDQSVLRHWFLKEPVEYKCSICGQEPFWNGKEMIMILDHINGKNHDNRLSNLRWVCPNCNSQLPTSNGRNIKHKPKEKVQAVVFDYKCPQCGNSVEKENTLCRPCQIRKHKQVTKPAKNELEKLIQMHGMTKTAKQLDIPKYLLQDWCKDYGILSKRELIALRQQKALVHNPNPSREARPVNQIDPATNAIINTFPNASAACNYVNGSNPSHIGKVCNGKQKSAYGYIWEYVSI